MPLLFLLLSMSFAFPTTDKMWSEFYQPEKLSERSEKQIAYCARKYVHEEKLLDEGILNKFKSSTEEIRLNCKDLVESTLIRSLWHDFQHELRTENNSAVEVIKIEGCAKEGFNRLKIGESMIAVMVFAERDHTQQEMELVKKRFVNLMNTFEANFDDCLTKLRNK